MNQLDPHSTSPMIFTLEDEKNTQHSDYSADWERSLQALRLRQEQEKQHRDAAPAFAPQDLVVEIENEPTPYVIHTPPPEMPRFAAEPPVHFGDVELDMAYQEYLRQREAEHNYRVRRVANDEDVGVLLQEDWLAAQTALQSERNRRYLHASKTVILNGNQPMQEIHPHDARWQQDNMQSYLPPCTVHVYDLPDLPSTRRIRVLSERELMQRLQEKLEVHLSNAMAGLVRQAVQKKLATLTYDLQVMLNEETNKVVQEVLEHNLAMVFRSVKDNLRDK